MVVGGLALAVAGGGFVGLCVLVWILMLVGTPAWLLAVVLIAICATIAVALRQVRRSALR